MAYSNIEKEIIFLKSVQEMIDEMVNYELFGFVGDEPQTEIRFNSYTHLKFFNIVLVDFLSKSEEAVVDEKISYLSAIRKICKQPEFNINQSVIDLKEATKDFTDWLNKEVEIDVWFLPFSINEKLTIKRYEFIKICGDISKHNFTRLSSDSNKIIEICRNNNFNISFEQSLMVLDEFYERFHDDILNYHGSTIVEFLNNIRWGIHKYLQPEFSQSISYDDEEPLKYSFKYPSGVNGDFTKSMYWDLMNAALLHECRSAPI